MEGTCETCPYFSALDGLCKRLPPMTFMVMQQNPLQPGQGKPGFLSAYPPTRKQLGCGEHPRNRNLPELEIPKESAVAVGEVGS